MAAAYSRSPRIVVRFAVYGGVAFVLAVAAGLWLTRNDAMGKARATVTSDASFLADRLGRDDLSRNAFLWPRRGDIASQNALLDDFLDPKNAARDAVRLTLVSSDGYVTYSTDPSLRGHRYQRLPTGTRVTHAGKVSVLESFVPVRWALDPGHIRGYLGFDRNYGPVSAQIRRNFLAQAGTLALALLVLYLALLPIMHRLTRRLERAFAERQQLAAIVETSNDAIIGRDGDGLVTSWNAGAEHMYGWSAEEAAGRNLGFLLPATDDEQLELADDVALTRTLHVRKDGRPVQVSLSISPIQDENGTLVGSSLIARDLTDVLQLQQELREAQRQEVVARFATAMANELDVLVRGIVPTDAGARGLELIRRLQDFGRVEEANPVTLDLNALIVGIRPRLDVQLGAAIELVLDPAAERGLVRADPQRIERVVIDLALSARDAMPDGGVLKIRTDNVDFSRRSTSREAALEAGHYVMLAVSDTGGAHHAERMGLGLATVFGLVEQSGGTIGIESLASGGTTVRVFLPRAELAAEAVA
jgi:PAS domain S-box-containing protein